MSIQEAAYQIRKPPDMQRGPGKTRIDVERLLNWAYRDEIPKGSRDGTGESDGISPMFKWADLGCRVDDWTREPGFPAAMGEPHPDALRIQLFVSCLADTEMDWQASKAALLSDLLALAPEKPPSGTLRLRTAALITMHAKMGTRPDWGHEPLVCHRVQHPGMNKHVVQRLDDDGTLVEGRDKNGNLSIFQSPRCPLRWEPDPASIAVDRAEYAAWHAGLVKLATTLRGELDEYEPLFPGAAAEPWAGEETVRRVLQPVWENG